jgi:hypothetical protein
MAFRVSTLKQVGELAIPLTEVLLSGFLGAELKRLFFCLLALVCRSSIGKR